MMIKFVMRKLGVCFFLLNTVALIPAVSHAASLTTYRIYLDDNNRTESFVVFASSNTDEQCSLDFKYFNFDENGKMTVPLDNSLPANAAEDWVRYSPRSFVLQKNQPQTVRFSMRRKPNTEAREYRSYIAVSCENMNKMKQESNETLSQEDRASVRITPKLVQNVPLIVRTGPLDVEASFAEIKVSEDKISGKILRSGMRSLFGRLSLMNKSNGEELAFTRSISIYPETSSYAFEFFTKDPDYPPVGEMTLRFTEDENYGGTLTFEKAVN